MLYSQLPHTWTTRSAAVNVAMQEEAIESSELFSADTQQEMQPIAQRDPFIPFGVVATLLLVSFATIMITNSKTTMPPSTSERLSTVPHYLQTDRPQ